MAGLLSAGRQRLRIIVTKQCRGFENTAILRAHSRHRIKRTAGRATPSSRDFQYGLRSSRQ
jgi:RNase P protein component